MMGAHRVNLELAQLWLQQVLAIAHALVDADANKPEGRCHRQCHRCAHHHPGIAHGVVDCGDVVLVVIQAGQGGVAMGERRPLMLIAAHLDQRLHLAHRVATERELDSAGLLHLEQV